MFAVRSWDKHDTREAPTVVKIHQRDLIAEEYQSFQRVEVKRALI